MSETAVQKTSSDLDQQSDHEDDADNYSELSDYHGENEDDHLDTEDEASQEELRRHLSVANSDEDEEIEESLNGNEVMENESIKSDHSDTANLDHSEDEIEEEFNSEYDNEQEDSIDDADSNVELEVSSHTPSGFNSDDHAFHLNFIRPSQSSPAQNSFKSKTTTRKNLSFSNDRFREIERHNRILLQKILSKGPKNSNSNTSISKNTINFSRASAAVNRKKQQRQIDLDNQILKRKIEEITNRRTRKLN